MKKCLLILLLVLSKPIAQAEPQIVVELDNTSNYIHSNVYTLRKIFTRSITKWDYNNTNIVVFTKPLNSLEHMEFVRVVLNMTPYNFLKQLERQVYAGKSTSITEIRDDYTMLTKVENTQGGIGYINFNVYIGNRQVKIIDAL